MNKKRKTAIIVSVVILLVVSLALTLTSCAPKVYKLNFDVDGAVVKTIDIPSVGTPELPDTPVKSGYTFAGWYFDKATLSDPCTAETIANKQFTADTVAYAKWLKNDYSITYNLDGGENAKANPSGYAVDTATITLNAPTKAGYTFDSWYGEDTFVTQVTEIAKGSTGNKTLYAKWTKDSYTIAYVLNGGTEVTTNPTTYAVDTVTFKLADPTKLCYTFGGWYDNAEFNGSAITAITKGSTGNKTLFAKWTAVVYTIKYVTNCATTVDDTTYDILTTPNSFATLTREGYVFEGWYDNFDIECNVITAITKDNIGNKILVAKWTKNNYTITYNLDGGTNVVANPSGYGVDTATFTLADPSKIGYTFGGWYEKADFDGTAITEITTGSTGNKTLYAKWTKNDYTITYNLDGGENAKTNPSGYTVDTATTIFNAPTKLGYTFGGWYGKADFDGTAITEIAKGSTGNKTLFAKWTIINYEIKYTGVEGATNTNPTTYNVESGTINIVAPTKAGYTFTGWSGTDLVGVANKTFTILAKSTGIREYVAHWTKDTYTITYELNGGSNGANPTTYAVDMVTFTLASPTKVGYTFGGWYGEVDFSDTAITEIAIGSTGNKTLYARWTKDSYTIAYVLDDGTEVTKNPTKYAVDTVTFKLADPTKVGYTFGGWYGKADFDGTAITEIAIGSTGNKTLYAKWTIINYEIKYIGVEGATNTNPTTYTIESGAINIVAPTKLGYTFTGWSGTDLVGAVNMTFVIVANSIGAREYTAHWTKDTYTITYELNGGSNGANPTTYAVDTVTFTLATPTKVGYTFDGWYGEANFSGTAITEIAKGSTGNKTLFAKWTIINYDIKYIGIEGATNTNPTTYTIESGAINIVAPTKLGYTFTGWSGTDLVGAANMTFTILVKSTGIREYTAHWTKDSYTIAYVLDGGTEVTKNPTKYAVDTVTFKLADPTKVGYTFGGWYGKGNFDGTAITEIAIGSTGNKTLYAKWTITTYTITYVGVDGVGAINPNATIATYTINSELITIQEATWKEGATFVGWSMDGNVANVVKSPTITKGSTGDITYTAHWTFTTYAITYELDGGINNAGNVDNYNIDTATITFATPTHTDCTDSFDGWYDAAIGGNKITTITRGSTGALTLYARWNFTATAGLTYTLINNNTEYEVSGTTMSGEVVIPRRHDNKLVTKIAANAFSSQRDITSVVIPSSVTSIGRAAFESCANVKSINIPDGVTSILANTFKGCAALVSMKIPEGVTSIGDSAFYGCAALESVNIPSAVKIIENFMFRSCKALKSVTISTNVASIGEQAFASCTSLISVTIPGNVKSVGNLAFAGCTALTRVTIQDGVTSIGDRAFQSCSILESIFIPSSVVTMGAGVFNGCTALTISCQCAETPLPQNWNSEWMGNGATVLWGQKRPTPTP